jgi:hypothetical protein
MSGGFCGTLSACRTRIRNIFVQQCAFARHERRAQAQSVIVEKYMIPSGMWRGNGD